MVIFLYCFFKVQPRAACAHAYDSWVIISNYNTGVGNRYLHSAVFAGKKLTISVSVTIRCLHDLIAAHNYSHSRVQDTTIFTTIKNAWFRMFENRKFEQN